LNIEFITMHKSKGLEADYVFLLGLNAGWGLTFPSSMTNDPLVDMLLTQRDPFPHAEERRLFYVALTRAKKRATVLFRQFNPSPFVLELMEDRYKGRVTLRNSELPERCDACGKGFLVPRSGPYGAFLGCTRYNSNGGCTNKRKIPKSA
jgi:DNA helicase-4